MYHFDNVETVLELEGVAGGASEKKSTALKSLESRPNDQYAYTPGLIIEASYTATETGAGTTLTIEDMINGAGSFSFEYNGHVVLPDLDALRIAQVEHQGDEMVMPSQRSSSIPTADVATAAGDTTVTLRLIVPFNVGHFKHTVLDKRTGLVPISEIARNGKLTWRPAASNLTDSGAVNNWLIDGDGVDMKITMPIVELPEPIEHVYTSYRYEITDDSSMPVIGDGARLFSCLLFTDDGDADMGIPASFNMWVDGKQRLSGQDGDDWVARENDRRVDGVNDTLSAVLPLVTLASRGQLEHCLVVRDEGKVTGMMSGDQTDYGQLARFTQRIPRRTQRDILTRQGIDAAIVDGYLDEMEARNRSDRDVGRSIAVLAAAAVY